MSYYISAHASEINIDLVSTCIGILVHKENVKKLCESPPVIANTHITRLALKHD